MAWTDFMFLSPSGGEEHAMCCVHAITLYDLGVIDTTRTWLSIAVR